MNRRLSKVSNLLLPDSLSNYLHKLIQPATKVQDTSLVEVRSAGDLGKGVFAVHDIARGTRIISEAPLVVVKPSLRPETAEKHVTEFCGAVRALSAEDVKTLDDLYFYQIQVDETMQRVIYEWLEQHGDKQGRKLNTRNLRRTTSRTMTQLSIFVINGMRMDGDASDGDGLFALYSRINHSCSPNVAKSYNPTIKRLTVHAIRDIKAGDQLFTDYVNGTLHPKTWRQTVLLDNWRFICQCRACTETEEAKLRGQMMKMVDRLILYENPESQRTGLEGSEGPPQTLQQALEAYEEIAALLRHPAVDLQSIALCKMSVDINNPLPSSPSAPHQSYVVCFLFS